MKLQFEPNLDCQHAAIEGVGDLFRGQETCRTEFTDTRHALTGQQVGSWGRTRAFLSVWARPIVSQTDTGWMNYAVWFATDPLTNCR